MVVPDAELCGKQFECGGKSVRTVTIPVAGGKKET